MEVGGEKGSLKLRKQHVLSPCSEQGQSTFAELRGGQVQQRHNKEGGEYHKVKLVGRGHLQDFSLYAKNKGMVLR